MRKWAVLIALVILFAVSAVWAEDAWNCPACGREGNTGNFCGGCGAPMPEETAGTEETAVPADAAEPPAAGDIVLFGRYEQDNDPIDGTEPIEWIVLDVQDGKALLLSRYGLDAIQYHARYTAVTWEECSLREWLNGEFLAAAFSAEEQAAIPETEIDNSAAQGCPRWDTDGGNNTKDRVFLLSCAEAKRYLGVMCWEDADGSEWSEAADVIPTAAAVAHGARTSDGTPATTGCWWLRSPGSQQSAAAHVYGNGMHNDTLVDSFGWIVRPAMWVDLGTF